MRASIIYVTFARDFEFIRYSLQSFKKFCKGFHSVVIVVPTHDLDLFLPLEKEFSTEECKVWIKNFLEFPNKGFVHHLAMECYADVFCADSDLIWHVDPDCLWIKPTTPQDYIVDKKPVLLIESFDALRERGHDGRYGWKKVVEDAVKFPVEYETMCRHPAVHYRRLYKMLRERIESVHQVPFIDYVLKCKNSFPQGFAEYPTMGAIALHFMKDKYHFIDRGYDRELNDPEPHLEQMWSYRLNDYRKRINEILNG